MSRSVTSHLMKHDARAEEGVLFQLKTRGPQTAAQVARRLGVTAMAVRQHLYRLQVESLVEFSDERRKVGRPARVWRLTSAAAERFPYSAWRPDGRIIAAVRRTFGEAGMDKLLRERTRRHIEQYRVRLDRRRFHRKARARAGRDSSRAGLHGRMRADARRLDAVGGESLPDLRGRIDLPGRYAAKSFRCSARSLATRRGSSAPITY